MGPVDFEELVEAKREANQGGQREDLEKEDLCCWLSRKRKGTAKESLQKLGQPQLPGSKTDLGLQQKGTKLCQQPKTTGILF